jgi:hypothetical protein
VSLKDLHFSGVTGLKVLIEGDIGSGKTVLTARLLEEAVVVVGSAKITVIDMAPEPRQFKGVMVGGYLSDYVEGDHGFRTLAPNRKLRAPRIEGHTADEVLYLARMNASTIQELLETYLLDPTPVLFANDVSMYLQAGDAKILFKTVAMADTFVGNSYSGLTLEEDNESGLSRRERSGLAALKNIMDRVVTLSSAASITEENTITK